MQGGWGGALKGGSRGYFGVKNLSLRGRECLASTKNCQCLQLGLCGMFRTGVGIFRVPLF